MKKTLSLIFLFTTVISAYAQKSKIKFIKGNIADKTAAVREADGEEADWVSNQAIDFCLENKESLGNDRELDGLAVAAILSYSPETVKKQNDIKENTRLWYPNTLPFPTRRASTCAPPPTLPRR